MTDANRETEGKRSAANGRTDGQFSELRAEELCSEAFYEQRIIHGSRPSGVKIEAAEFDQCRFESAVLSKSKWHKLRLRDVCFSACDLANARWTSAGLDRVVLEKCRGVGLELLDAHAVQSEFRRSKFHLAAFHGSKIRECVWTRCDLREANFEGVDLTDVIFRDCDLRAARFPNCRLKNVDFRGSLLTGMQVDAGMLRGAVIEPAQLLDLADRFGLIVKDLCDE